MGPWEKIEFSNVQEVTQFLEWLSDWSKKLLIQILKQEKYLVDNMPLKGHKEGKESKEKHPIEKQTFTIDWNLSVEEKIAKGWKLLKDQETSIIKNNEKIELTITILENSLGDVWEFVDGVPEEYKWKQLFTPEAAERETQSVGKTMIKNPSEFNYVMQDWESKNQEKINQEKNAIMEIWGSYNPTKFFLKNNYPLLWYRKPNWTYLGMGVYTNIRFEWWKCLLFANWDVRSKMPEPDLHKCWFQVICYA